MRQKTRQLAFEWEETGESRSLHLEGHESSPALPETVALARDVMEAVVEPRNMRRALKRVRANKGSPGIDGMTVRDLGAYLEREWSRLRRSLLDGTYCPAPVKRVSIRKPGGGMRELGIPTVVDRLIQQALLQVLTPQIDPTFSEHSFGFRPGRKAHDAVEAAREFVSEGRHYVVDLDLEKFFDRVNHDVLMARVVRRIGDKRVLSLIRGYLEAGVMLDGVVCTRHQGTPQGGPLSPLLANILLDDLDQELMRRGHAFCRYADDCNIYVRSRRAGERVLSSVSRFLEQVLRLRVNREKSGVDRPWKRKFLGFRIYLARRQEAALSIAPQALKRAKDRIRRLTRRNRGVSLPRMLSELRTYTDGWVGYFHRASGATVFAELDQWIRRRIRCYQWKQWKHPYRRARELIKAGVGRYLAWGTAYDGPGLWRAAGSPALHKALTVERLSDLGYHSLHERYLALRGT